MRKIEHGAETTGGTECPLRKHITGIENRGIDKAGTQTQPALTFGYRP